MGLGGHGVKRNINPNDTAKPLAGQVLDYLSRKELAPATVAGAMTGELAVFVGQLLL
ncbi:MAG: hypothetical protein L0332_23655 [Chloroflexi bacterium]|nr:hypothetical protein [Chloroflexota bacterium]MCI0729689.1 hypothetical protein [Chloroflexota bacterium]